MEATPRLDAAEPTTPEPADEPAPPPDLVSDDNGPLVRKRHDAGIPLNDPNSVF